MGGQSFAQAMVTGLELGQGLTQGTVCRGAGTLLTIILGREGFWSRSPEDLLSRCGRRNQRAEMMPAQTSDRDREDSCSLWESGQELPGDTRSLRRSPASE